jgi:hypothetical protein
MKSIKNIKHQIQRLIEAETVRKFPMPPEIKDTLENKLRIKPLIRFVKGLKAANSIPPSYRIFLLNNKHFDIYYEEFSLMIKIGPKEYYIADLDERNYAVKHINRLMTEPILKTGDEEEDMEGDVGGGAGPLPMPTTPTPPPPPPPVEEPDEEPEEPEV